MSSYNEGAALLTNTDVDPCNTTIQQSISIIWMFFGSKWRALSAICGAIIASFLARRKTISWG